MSLREAVERRIRERKSSSHTPSPEFKARVEERIKGYTEIEKAYLGGEIRAEGYISHFYLPSPSRGIHYCYYRLTVRHTTAEEEVAEKIEELFRKIGTPYKRYDEKALKWEVGIYGKSAAKLLRQILPYMTGAKREAAEMALKYPSLIRCEEGRPPLPRYKRPPQSPHSLSGKVWTDFYLKHRRPPTIEEWARIKPRE